MRRPARGARAPRAGTRQGFRRSLSLPVYGAPDTGRNVTVTVTATAFLARLSRARAFAVSVTFSFAVPAAASLAFPVPSAIRGSSR